MGLATPEAFQANPSRVWQFYHYRREKYDFAPSHGFVFAAHTGSEHSLLNRTPDTGHSQCSLSLP